MDDSYAYQRSLIDANDALEHKALVGKRALENITGIALNGLGRESLGDTGKLRQVYEIANQALLTIEKVPTT